MTRHLAGELPPAISVITAREHDEAIGQLRCAAELAVHALLELLPLEGSWGSGYHVASAVHSKVRALPEEWASAAHAVSVLHRVILRGERS